MRGERRNSPIKRWDRDTEIAGHIAGRDAAASSFLADLILLSVICRLRPSRSTSTVASTLGSAFRFPGAGVAPELKVCRASTSIRILDADRRRAHKKPCLPAEPARFTELREGQALSLPVEQDRHAYVGGRIAQLNRHSMRSMDGPPAANLLTPALARAASKSRLSPTLSPTATAMQRTLNACSDFLHFPSSFALEKEHLASPHDSRPNRFHEPKLHQPGQRSRETARLRIAVTRLAGQLDTS